MQNDLTVAPTIELRPRRTLSGLSKHAYGDSKKILTLTWCLVLTAFCLFGILASDEMQGTRRVAWKAGYATAGLGFVALAVWRLRKP